MGAVEREFGGNTTIDMMGEFFFPMMAVIHGVPSSIRINLYMMRRSTHSSRAGYIVIRSTKLFIAMMTGVRRGKESRAMTFIAAIG